VSVAVVVLTHNRLEKLRLCVERVIAVASPAVTEVIIWNNGSTDGTRAYLDTVELPNVRVVQCAENVGMVAYGRAFETTTAPYLLQLDDDVVAAPPGWDQVLLDACARLPEFGYLAADVEENEGDRLSTERHQVHRYAEIAENGVSLLEGPTGGWCTITSRSVYDRVGGLPTQSRQTYFSTDTVYVAALERHGYRRAIVRDVRVRHDGDRAGAAPAPEKAAFHAREERILRRRQSVKRVLLVVPFVRALNRRHRWFEEPGARPAEER
jgi:GT2 family glycosyltransferase